MTEWNTILQDFHFLRPWWLVGLVLVPIIFYIKRRFRSNSSGWDAVMSPELLAALMPKSAIQKLRRTFEILAVAASILAFVALAGPSWQKLPQPVEQKDDDLVLVLDLSYSMYVQDMSPSRLERAKQKVIDVLRNREEGNTGMVAYAGDAHVVTPLTNDTNTIQHLVSSLDPSMMPIPGSNTREALQLAIELLRKGSRTGGRILLLADDIQAPHELTDLELYGTSISVVGIGTEEGGPIPVIEGDGSVSNLLDFLGRVVTPTLDRAKLRRFAQSNGGSYHDIALNDNDVAAFFDGGWKGNNGTSRLPDREFDQWYDSGYLLLVPIILLALLGLRRGAVVVALLVIAPSIHADWKDDLWVNRDSQGHKAMEKGQLDEAEELFEDPDWQAVAKYRNGKFDEAADLFGADESVRSRFNLGNALAKDGQFQEAIDTYDRVLEEEPDHEDAAFNKELLEQLLEQLQDQAQGGEQADGQESLQGQGQAPQQGQEQGSDPSDSEGQPMDAPPGEQGDSQSGTGEPNEQPSSEQEGEGDQQDENGESPQQEEDGELGNDGTTDTNSQNTEEREAADAFDRWLRRIPDEPGNLLKAKFRHETIQKLRRGEITLNDSEQEW